MLWKYEKDESGRLTGWQAWDETRVRVPFGEESLWVPQIPPVVGSEIDEYNRTRYRVKENGEWELDPIEPTPEEKAAKDKAIRVENIKTEIAIKLEAEKLSSDDLIAAVKKSKNLQAVKNGKA
jgi:hypothetical protein